MTLAELTLTAFSNKLAADSSTPGGGSAAALAGAMSAALCAMIARLTLGRSKYEKAWPEMEQVRSSADDLMQRLLALVDKDTEAYNGVVAALRMPKGNDRQKARRQEALEAAYKQAAMIPMETLRTVAGLVTLVERALEKGNPNCVTDAGVSAQLLRAAAVGAAYNVRINLMSIEDKDFSAKLKREALELVAHTADSADRLGEAVERSLG